MILVGKNCNHFQKVAILSHLYSFWAFLSKFQHSETSYACYSLRVYLVGTIAYFVPSYMPPFQFLCDYCFDCGSWTETGKHLAYIATRGGDMKIENYIDVSRNALRMTVKIDYSCFIKATRPVCCTSTVFLATAESCFSSLAL